MDLQLIVVLLTTYVVSPAPAQDPPLSCHHKDCRYLDCFSYLESDTLIKICPYKVNGKRMDVALRNTTMPNLEIFCHGANVFQSPARPRAVPALHLNQVELDGCPLPTNGSLANQLTALNIVLEPSASHLKLNWMPPTIPLTAKHFVGLENLTSLFLSGGYGTRTVTTSGFLDRLQSLKELEIWNLEVSTNDLYRNNWPISLQKLQLKNVHVDWLPKALCLPTSLVHLSIESRHALHVAGVGPLVQTLFLSSPATTLELGAIPALQTLNLANWTKLKPNPFANCSKLEVLILTAPAMSSLPESWLADCSALRKIEIQYARNLTSLPQMLLVNLTRLTDLIFKHGVLKTLPEDILQHTQRLNTLDLSFNNLDNSAMHALVVFESGLKVLNLRDNPQLGDLCNNTSSYSILWQLKYLTDLFLQGTSVTLICRDWRENTMLSMLDLSNTKLKEITFEDLQFEVRWNKKTVVLLSGTLVELTREQFEEVRKQTDMLPSGTVVYIRSELACDCRMYWTRRALDFGGLAHIVELRCTGNRDLSTLSPEDMVCPAPDECAAFEGLPAECACSWRPDDDVRRRGPFVRVNCSRAGLRRVPRVLAHAAPPRRYQLLLDNNNITQLHADDLHDDIKGLDLRNNFLSRVDNATAVKLALVAGALRLAGNPLECDCHAVPLLSTLHRRAQTDTDLREATCRDGSALIDASLVECAPATDSSPGAHLTAGLAAGHVVMLALALAVVVSLGSRERRFFARAVLHRWGCLWRAAEPDVDAARPYDAFVTFSHVDEAVAREVVARLEPRYRLCVHYRDWVPGQLISSQIVESVELSRRTVALVSRHFLASMWARAEFREAHAASLRDPSHRLVLVLLEDPQALPLDAQLRRYINTNTYVRWGDPWFWDKLQVSLPPPRT